MMKSVSVRDDALAPVVAFLLLLTVVVSCISLLNAYYIPSLKQQEEIDHLQSVEEVFLSLTGDISTMTMVQRDSSLQRHISLGGGAVIFSPITSSGTLQLHQAELLDVIVTGDGDKKIPITTVAISYEPIGNFWVDQGYIWERGVVNVTKASRQTWLEYVVADDANKAKNSFLRTIFIPQFLTNSSLSVYTLTADTAPLFRSGNGRSGINMLMEKTSESGLIRNVTNVTLVSDDPVLQELIEEWKPSTCDSIEDGKCSFEIRDLTVEIYEIKMSTV
jgi:hypothetical protein